MRTATAYAAAMMMKATGFRFSKSYRHGETAWHRLVYRCCDVVKANRIAGL